MTFGPIWTGLSKGLFASWTFAVLSSSELFPIVLTALDHVYDASRSNPFEKRRRVLTMRALYSLFPRLRPGRFDELFGLRALERRSVMRRLPVAGLIWFSRGL